MQQKISKSPLLFSGFLFVFVWALDASSEDRFSPQWEQIEIAFEVQHREENPYLEVNGKVVFVHEDGEEIVRPIFWNGKTQFMVRFASTRASGVWTWNLFLDQNWTVNSVTGGRLQSVPGKKTGVFSRKGFWKIPRGKRHMVYRDGSAVLMVADTPWALPWRATREEVLDYATDRQRKGFNAALLMTIQPDRGATGPRDRNQDEGFAVAFEDLPKGTLTQMNVGYFQYLDNLIKILRDHDIVPVFQPVFHGFGWKGLQTAGPDLSSEDYVRFCKYLVARYGAGPSIWLVGGDGVGDAISLNPAGHIIEKWDSYEHPTGMHYAPDGITDSFQGETWLDFQWCQTGHGMEHRQDILMALFHQKPTKAVANGEPTYECISKSENASGWWQGHEAWSNLCAGGTMGVVYGAGSLWNWVHHPHEPGHQEWTIAPGCGWREALEFSGSTYVGNIGKILNQYEIKDSLPVWNIAPAKRSIYSPGQFFMLYLPNGGSARFGPFSDGLPRHFRVYNPQTAEVLEIGRTEVLLKDGRLRTHTIEPRVIVFFN